MLATKKKALALLAATLFAGAAHASRTDFDGAPLRVSRVERAQLETRRFELALERGLSEERFRLFDSASIEALALPETRLPAFDFEEPLSRLEQLELTPRIASSCAFSLAAGCLGKTISADPLDYVDGPNVYAYARNNPLAFTDPLGLEAMLTVTADGKEVKEEEITGQDLQKMLIAEGLSAKEASRIVIEAGMGEDIGADKTKALAPNILAAGTVIEDATKVGVVVWGAPVVAAAATAAPGVIAAAKGTCLLNAVACTEVVVGGVGAVMGIEGPDPVTVPSPAALARGAQTGGQFLEEVLPMAARAPGWRPALRAAAGAQNHHLISNPIADALEQVGLSSETVKALRDNPALQKMSIPGGHVGYEDWHRAYDDYMVNYIQAKGPANFNVSDFFQEIESYYGAGEAARRIPGVSLANP